MPSWESWLLLGLAIVATGAVVMFIGIVIGYKLYAIDAEAKRLQGEIDNLSADDDEPGDAVITTTPALLEQKRRAGKLNDNDAESAIVTVKSPRQLRKEDTIRREAEIDHATGTHRLT